MEMESKPIIPEFYVDQKILITGATGFIGKVLIWKLLKSCPLVDTIYVLIRAKWGKSDEERLQELLDSVIFDNFKKTNPEILKKVVLIQGDMQKKNLNLSESDRQKLEDEVTVVFHVAAMLKMNGALKESVKMNVEGTITLLNICTNMKNLKVFVYVSTAYSNGDTDVIDDKVYPAKHNPYDIIQLVNWLDSESLEKITPGIMKPHPVIYTYSKRLAENVVSDFYPRLPVVITRPSIVASSHIEPLPGYIDNMKGVVGLVLAIGKGVLRHIYGDSNYLADLIPVDNVCNALIVIAREEAENKKKQNSIPVYNICLSKDKLSTWDEGLKAGFSALVKCPPSLMLWYPRVTIHKYKITHVISTVLFQWIPAYIVDFLFILFGYERIMVRVQRKLAFANSVLKYFGCREWPFDNSKLIRLQNSLNTADQALFPTSATVIGPAERELFLYKSMLFGRQYMLKEDPSNIPRSIRILKILYVLDCIVRILFYACILWLIYKIFDFYYK